jgi:membrane associated rhomboid family serine protease
VKVDQRDGTYGRPAGREPMFNMPAVVVGMIALILGLHAARAFILSTEQDNYLLLLFAFIPARYDGADFASGLPGGLAADLWSPITYALLHASVMHAVINVVWLAAFGSAVARRLGATRFILFSAGAALAGAALQFLIQDSSGAPMIGASAAISGHMAAAARFIFTRPRLAPGRIGGAGHAPLAPLAELFRNRQVVSFLGVWFGINLLIGLVPMIAGSDGLAIAWEAHIGGFLFGLFAFPLFDRRG